MNNKLSPKDFELSVGKLLQLSGYVVQNEILLSHKKVDLYCEEVRRGKIRRIGVECKTNTRPLDLSIVNTIFTDYSQLFSNNLIDEIMLVTMSGLSAAANTFINKSREMTHLTFYELHSTLIEFTPYLNGLKQQYMANGLQSYYVNVNTVNEGDLETYVINWIDNIEENYPIAILGSYGIGKTTFAKRIAFLLAERAALNPAERIPILIKLADISSEQSLEGLLGKLFTAYFLIRNYNFEIFMELNKMGRFVILLDGFDEMKHTLSWEEFKYNFRQINRLFNTKSKLILFGRPTAFLNKKEHDHALHGKRIIGKIEINDPDWPDYKEILLRQFRIDQIKLFIDNYYNYKKSSIKDEAEHKKLDIIMKKFSTIITSGKLIDIASRPVQLKMLADLLPQLEKSDLDNITVTLLYELFIDMMIEREQEKIPRRYFEKDDRKDFAKDLALWLWTSKREMTIKAEDIPLSIIEKYAIRKGNSDYESVRRDLVAACFLERKIGDSLYFSHRSFQEFLVAEILIEKLLSEEITFDSVEDIVNDEIALFIEGLINIQTIKRFEKILLQYKGIIPYKLIKAWLSDKKYITYIKDKFAESINPWYTLMLTLAIKNFDYIYLWDNIKHEFKDNMERGDAKYALLSFYCVLVLLNDRKLSFIKTPYLNEIFSILIDKRQSKGIYDGSKWKKEIVMDPIIRDFISSLSIDIKYYIVKISNQSFDKLLDYCMITDYNFNIPGKIYLSSKNIQQLTKQEG